MSYIRKLARSAPIAEALASLEETAPQVEELAVAIQQIPAPTFAEAPRAEFIHQRLLQIGLRDVACDPLNNVYARLPAVGSPIQPPVIISAHVDSVFPPDTDLTVHHNGRFIYGPGIADNATGLAGLVHLAKVLAELKLELPADVWFVANVGEEGLGDLRGMRAVVNRFGREATYIVLEGGLYGQISVQAIAVQRFRIEVKAPGGHSWGSFGKPSAVHELGHIIAAIDQLPVPSQPKTSFNVGVIQGGTSINTIAHEASLLLDLRSEGTAELDALVTRVREIVAQANKRNKAGGRGEVHITIQKIGDRPAGRLQAGSPLAEWAEEALRFVGCKHIIRIAGSTDANIPLSEGIPAVCIGLAESGNAHRPDEYIDPRYLPQGMGQLLLLVLASAGYLRESSD